MKYKNNKILGLMIAAAGATAAVRCSPYAAPTGPKRSLVWGLLPMGAVVTGSQQHDMTVQTPYWPFMQVIAEKKLFAVKFSWMRPDEQPSALVTGAWFEFLAPQGGSFDEEPEAVHGEVESASGKIPVRVVRLSAEGGRYFVSGVPTRSGQGAKLFITAEFGERQDTVVIPLSADLSE